MNTDIFRSEVEMTYEKVKSLAGWAVDKDVVLTDGKQVIGTPDNPQILRKGTVL